MFAAPQNLTITVVAVMRTDVDVLAARGNIGEAAVALVSPFYDNTFPSIPSAVEMAIAGFQTLIPSPHVITGALATDAYG